MNRIIFSKIVTVTLILGLLSSCGKLEFFQQQFDDIADPSIVVSYYDELPIEDDVRASRAVQDINFKVTSNASWTASVNSDASSWCSVSPPSNRGNARMLVRLKYNAGAKARRATIRVAYNETAFHEFDIVQNGAPLLSGTQLTTAKFKSSNTLVVAAPEAWSAVVRYDEQDAKWCILDNNSGEDGVFNVNITTSINTTAADRKAYVDITSGETSETLEITQLGILEDINSSIDKSADTLRIKWNKIIGATGYKISATNIGSVVVDTTKTAYDFLFAQGNLFNSLTYVGMTDISVEALTDDTDIAPIVTAPLSTHTMYDDNSGDGTSESSPLIVSNRRHLSNIRRSSTSHFKQTSTVDLDGFDDDNSSINGNFTPIPIFSGVYDGGGLEIKNLKINSTSTTPTAPFIALTGSSPTSLAILKNIKMVTPEISISVNAFASALVASATENFLITDCHIVGGSLTCVATTNTVGGIVANAPNTNFTTTDFIKNCSNQGCNIIAGPNTGGIVGVCAVNVENCYNTADISGAYFVGGIVSSLFPGGTIKKCYNKGNIISTRNGNLGIGGIVGRAYGSATISASIEECFNTGTIEANAMKSEIAQGLGGIVGAITNENTYIRSCYNVGKVITVAVNANAAGGILGTFNNTGNNNTPMIYNCYNIGLVDNGYGIVGKRASNTNISISGNFFLDTSAVQGSATLSSGFASQTEAQMKSLANYIGWSHSIWRDGDDSYLYPQLINNPHK